MKKKDGVIMIGNKVIVHVLVKTDSGYLVMKRSKEESAYQEYWDIPGGSAEEGELPREAAIRETKEEAGLDIIPLKVIHEDSRFDDIKNAVYIRLVYSCEVKSDINNIVLQQEEHTEYRFIKSLKDLEGEKITPFVMDLFNNI
jgi:8-oxo-dGTP diphosphatase